MAPWTKFTSMRDELITLGRYKNVGTVTAGQATMKKETLYAQGETKDTVGDTVTEAGTCIKCGCMA